MAPGDLGRPRRKDKHIPLRPEATRREAVGEGTWPKGPGEKTTGIGTAVLHPESWLSSVVRDTGSSHALRNSNP